MTYPVSLAELSAQDRSTSVLEKTLAARVSGVAGIVVADAGALFADELPVLLARMRYVYCVPSSSPAPPALSVYVAVSPETVSISMKSFATSGSNRSMWTVSAADETFVHVRVI